MCVVRVQVEVFGDEGLQVGDLLGLARHHCRQGREGLVQFGTACMHASLHYSCIQVLYKKNSL